MNENTQVLPCYANDPRIHNFDTLLDANKLLINGNFLYIPELTTIRGLSVPALTTESPIKYGELNCSPAKSSSTTRLSLRKHTNY